MHLIVKIQFNFLKHTHTLLYKGKAEQKKTQALALQHHTSKENS